MRNSELDKFFKVESVSKQLIEAAKDLRKKNVDKLWIVPMYGSLPASEQVLNSRLMSFFFLTCIYSNLWCLITSILIFFRKIILSHLYFPNFIFFQLKAFDSTPYGTRKIVIATNIAETSLTIPGITYG